MNTFLPTFLKSKHNFYFIASFVFLLFGSYQKTQAQVSGYQLDQLQITPAYAPLIATSTPTPTYLAPTTGLAIDNGVYNVAALPFTFQFNGANYTSANVSMNGFITFGATAPSLTETTPISSTTGYMGAISAFGSDLDIFSPSTTRTVSYHTIGTAPNRITKFNWTVIRHTNSAVTTPNGTDTMLFQIWLYETTNVIEMHYNTNVIGANNYFGQIGLRGSSNTDFKNLDFAAPAHWPGIAPAPVGTMPLGTVNTANVLFRNTAQIQANSNRLFRWTPVTCAAPTGLNLTAGSITSTSATLNWTASASLPPNGYDYFVTTSATAPTGATIPTGTVAAGVTTVALTGLTAGNYYYVYVRSKCASENSSWSTVLNFTTFCTPVNIPYIQQFNVAGINTVAPNHQPIPTCTTQQNAGLGNNWVTTYSDTYYPEAFMDEYVLMYNGQNPGNANPANAWWYTEGINLAANTTYTINYLYGGDAGTVTNRLRVAYGTYPVATNMTTLLDDHPNIKTSSINNIVNFTSGAAGVYYFGFQAYSAAAQGQMFLDDVQIYLSTCLRPTAVSVSSISSSTAVLSWTAPVPAPASGYAYYITTSSTAPVNGTLPNGFTAAGVNNVTLTGLTGSTTYYFYVRANCGGGEYGEWVELDNAGDPFFTTLVTPPAYCTPAPTSVDGSGITNVTMGTINNSTGAEPGNYGNYSSLFTNTPQGALIPVAITYTTAGFNYNTKIWVDWNDDGDFYDAGENVYTGLSGTTSPTTLNASFTVPAGAPLGFHRLRIGGADIDTLTGVAAGQGPCYNGAWGSFEDYSINVVVPPPALTISSNSSVQCAGSPSPTINLTTPIGNFNTYSWSPSTGVTGSAAAGWVITNTSTVTYTLTGIQTTAPFSTNTVTFTYNANPLPTPIIISTPSGTVACPAGSAPALPITTTGGIVSGINILTEDFNTGAPAWTSANTSTGGASAAPAWTIRPNGYNRPPVYNSNDNSSFMFSDSDAQGSGTNTNVTLVSPVFSLAGFTSASVSFWHYYRNWTPSTAAVQVSTDGGATWTTIQSYTTITQGTPTTFVQAILNLNPYIGQTNMRLRFSYVATWGWYWAIDNVRVFGSTASAVTWSPAAGLFTDAAATIPYVAGTGAATVYALPTAAVTYTATASTLAPVCTTSSSINLTVTPLTAGTASANQTICSGLASDLTLVGHSGTITGWQSADNLAFTVGVAAIPASASATLTSAQMGTITSNKYFRAVVTNGGCTAFSNVVSITLDSTTWNGSAWSNLPPTATKTAIFAGNFSSTANITACSVIVNSGTITINSGHTFTVQNNVTVSGGSFVFENGSSLLQINDSATNTGNITYKRTTTPVNRFDFTYWSSPVTPQTLSALSPLTLSDKYFEFNPVINNWQNIASSNLMVAGKGYIIRAPQTYDAVATSVYTGSFVGVPNNGTISVNAVASTGTLNLLGNPYPSAINADLFMSDAVNDARIGGTIWLWTHNTPITSNNYFFNDYAIYTYSGGIGTGTAALNPGVNSSVPTGMIAAGQGFMIEATIPASSNPVFFRNTMRVAGNNTQFYRTGSEDKSGNSIFSSLEKNRVWLEVFNEQGHYKQILVGYIENATDGLDKGYDGKVFDIGNPVFLYTMVEGNKLGIQGKALPFEVSDLIPLGFKSTTTGTFQFRISDFDGLFENQNVYIEDTYLNVIHNIKDGNYSFSTNAGTFEDRFVLRFTNSTLSTTTNVFNENTVVIYKDVNDAVNVNANNLIIDSITIHDVRGRLIYEEKSINTTQKVITTLNSAEQVLIVTVTSTDGQKVTKKIIF